MIQKNIRQYIRRHLTNIQGWHTNRKIIVIESDDWGSIRMPSRQVYQKLLKAGIRVDKCPYNRYDNIASKDDLSSLFDILSRFRDKNGNHPIITANTVVANPNFEKIKASGYKEYYYEPFTKTLTKYSEQYNLYNIWEQGIQSCVFHPQFHGREHVNIPLWLSLLHEGHKEFKLAFDYGLWGLGPEIVNIGPVNIQASFDSLNIDDIKIHKEIITDGLNLFEKIFGYKSKSFIANNFVWDSCLNPILAEKGVDIFQGMKYQKHPFFDTHKRKMTRHTIGEINGLGQIYLIRNCTFEPTQYTNIDSVSTCLKDIANAFLWKRPAIISSHRLNFIGSIDEKNRTKNLGSLKNLLESINNKWPDVEYMTSDQLGSIIMQSDMTNF